MKKILLVLLYILDLGLIAFSLHVLKVWKDLDGGPGLYEGINPKRPIAYIVIAIIVFIVLTLLLIKDRLKKRRQ